MDIPNDAKCPHIDTKKELLKHIHIYTHAHSHTGVQAKRKVKSQKLIKTEREYRKI